MTGGVVLEMISHCGLVCSDCPAWIAGRTGDDELRRKTAAEWSQMYGAAIEAADIDCAGCLPAGGRHFHHCGECAIRACGIARGTDNCGLCGEYPSCATISGFLEMVPSAKAVLDALAAGGKA
jgi:hypothetical protein